MKSLCSIKSCILPSQHTLQRTVAATAEMESMVPKQHVADWVEDQRQRIPESARNDIEESIGGLDKTREELQTEIDALRLCITMLETDLAATRAEFAVVRAELDVLRPQMIRDRRRGAIV